MTIKRILFRSVVRSLERLTLSQKPRMKINLPLFKVGEEKAVDVYVVAFNNPELIRVQYLLLKKFYVDNFTYIVVDNSSKRGARECVARFCKENDIAYVSMPFNFLNKIGTSYSHAMCLNYICKRILAIRQPFAVAFLDHDIFPIKKYSFMENLAHQPVYGVLRERGAAWYIWPGMASFRLETIAPEQLDFMPTQTNDSLYMDTGGSIWWRYYQFWDRETINFPQVEQVAIREGEDYHGDMIQYIDNRSWIHTINGSCWKQIDEGKDEIIRDLLNQYY